MKVHVFALHGVFINELVTSRSLVCMLKSLKFFLSWKCNFLGGALMHIVNRIITARSLVYIFQNLKFLSSWKCDFVAGACMCACFYIRRQPNMKCIIFVNRIVTARSLAYILQNLKFLSYWKCDFLVGVHSD
ncbi:Endoribonuclease Dicer-like 4 [Vitis vinifera]|uniref:Endoribonuclease Dicer-like 4 n=1 Tax=Vitis vinifera TaxID=29760 RepID=A0A438E7H4_VITVI|nr:Endoribonuclease Dicer-like 4 [Vitis vinifera]